MPFRLRHRRTDDTTEATADPSESLLMTKADEGKYIAYFPEGQRHPAFWKVSSGIGTSRVFASQTQKMPDSEIRRGETDAQWRLRMLVRDFQALASDPDTLLAAYDGQVPVLYDLINDFKFRLECAAAAVNAGAMTQEMWNKASAVRIRLDEMPDLGNSSRWTAEVLRGSDVWRDVRRCAQEALAAMGCGPEPPSPRSM